MSAIKYITTACLLLVISSCELERLDYTEIYPENFFKTENDLKLAVNFLYYDFNPGDFKGVYSAGYDGYQVMSDLTTDALWCSWGWESDEYYYHQWYATMGGNLADDISIAFARYNYLSKARNTIRRIENSQVDDKAKSLYSGEAKALRAWMGLYLYDLFGSVPVAPDEVLDKPQEFVYLSRLTDEEYDKMMENDLRDAIRDLPEKAEARGRMTKGAARMLLLKYYMIRGFFDKAEILARELYAMEGDVYSLQPNYQYVFSKEGIGNNEIILQIPCNSTSSTFSNYMTAEVLPADYPWSEKAEGWGGYVLPWDFYDTFELGDKRLEGLKTSYMNKKGVFVDKSNSAQLAKGALPLKYGVDPDMIGAKSGIDIVVFRYSDVLLSLAECIVRNSGQKPTAEAVSLVNRVRNRAGLDNLREDKISTKEAFLEAVLLERGHEFYLEGLRRQDLIRFGKYVEFANERINKANASGQNYFNVDDGHCRFFIPQYYIDESKGNIKQNNYSR